MDTHLDLSVDSEGYPHSPWSLQFAAKPGEGFLVRANDLSGVAGFQQWVAKWLPTITMHNALYDIKVLRAMGIDLIELECPLSDTMLMAYELGVIPVGLKPLAVRECAMPMLDYKDVLGDAQDRHARTYVQFLWEGLNDELQRMRQEDFDFQTRVRGRRIKKLPALPKPKLMGACERVLASKRPAGLWLDQVIDLHTEAYKRARMEMPEASLSDVEPAVALRYAARDPDATGRVKAALWPRVVDMGLEPVYRLDLATYPIIDRMTAIGLKPDPAAFKRLAAVLDGELDGLREKLRETTGIPEFNPNSGDQTATYVFDTLGLEMLGKRTDSGRGSTNDKVLEALEKMYPEYSQIAEIRSYREYYKLRWTFVERLPEMVDRWPYDERLHCELMLTRTPSGRLAAKNPNLLAMPKHGKFAKAFRRCFVPEDGRLLLSLDMSQAELRVGAHLSQDPVMLAIYRGETRNPDGSLIDLHTNMCKRLLGRPEKTSAERTAAKACYHPDTEVLTKQGWVRIGDVSRDEEIIQAYPDSQGVRLEWTRPLDVFTQPNPHTTLRHFSCEGFDIRVTPDHRMVGWSAERAWTVRQAKDIHADSYRAWESAGTLNTHHPKSDERWLRLAVACQADGHYKSSRVIEWGFSKARKIERLRGLLAAADVPYEERTHQYISDPKPVTRFLVRCPDANRSIRRLLDTDKTLPWRWLNLGLDHRLAVLDEAAYWDSHQLVNGRAYLYSSAIQKNIDVLQALAVVSGCKTNQHAAQVLTVKDHSFTRGGNLSIEDIPYTGPVVCVSVPSSFILVRDAGRTLICGNCNFGYWMGQTWVGLKLECQKSGLDISDDDAKQWIAGADELYKGAVTYKQAMVAEAEKNGYIRCPMSGRIRYIGGIRSKDERVRAEAQRFAYSTPIQEGAQTLGKGMLARAWHEVYVPARKRGQVVEPLLWTHDDLLSEVEANAVVDTARALQSIMSTAPDWFTVPLATTPEAGLSWAEMLEVF